MASALAVAMAAANISLLEVVVVGSQRIHGWDRGCSWLFSSAPSWGGGDGEGYRGVSFDPSSPSPPSRESFWIHVAGASQQSSVTSRLPAWILLSCSGNGVERHFRRSIGMCEMEKTEDFLRTELYFLFLSGLSCNAGI